MKNTQNKNIENGYLTEGNMAYLREILRFPQFLSQPDNRYNNINVDVNVNELTTYYKYLSRDISYSYEIEEIEKKYRDLFDAIKENYKVEVNKSRPQKINRIIESSRNAVNNTI